MESFLPFAFVILVSLAALGAAWKFAGWVLAKDLGTEAMQKFDGRFHMAPMGNYCASEIDAMIQERKQKTGAPCDLIVVDHLDKMAASRKDVGVASFDSTKTTDSRSPCSRSRSRLSSNAWLAGS